MNSDSADGHPTLGPSGRPGGIGGTAGGSLVPTANQLVTNWFIDPAGTNIVPGNDRNSGTSALSPLKSIARWRQLVAGARYGAPGWPSNPIINVLSSSAVIDDGLFYGFTTNQQTSFVSLLAAPQIIGTGALTAGTVGYVGNARALLVDSAVPTGTWAGAGYVTTVNRSRFIRKVGVGLQPHAPILLDTNGTLAHSAMPSVATNIDDSVVSFFPSPVEVNFAAGDAYQVVGFFTWPQLQVGPTISVAQQNLDIIPVGNVTGPGATKLRLCGIVSPTTSFGFISGSAQTNMYMCVFAITQPAGVAFTGSNWVTGNCGFLNTLFAVSGGGPDLVFAAKNVFVNGFNRYYKGCNLSAANFRHYDFTNPLFDCESASRVSLEGGIVGSGNTGKLVLCINGAILQGASGILATTTDPLPYSVTGVSYAGPTVDGNTGNGVYS